jgi:hypothetical protein
MFVCMYVLMYVCMYVSSWPLHECLCVYTYTYIHTHIHSDIMNGSWYIHAPPFPEPTPREFNMNLKEVNRTIQPDGDALRRLEISMTGPSHMAVILSVSA